MKEPYYHKILISQITTKKQPLTFRRIPRVKSALLFEAEKELKKVALSSRSFTNYMNKIKYHNNKNKSINFSNQQILAYAKVENKMQIPKRELSQKFPTISFRESSMKKANTLIIKNKIKDNSYINFNNFENTNNYEEYNNEDNNIKEMPYGFLYKDTRIVFDKNKLKIKSSLLNDNNIKSDANKDEIFEKIKINKKNFKFSTSGNEKSEKYEEEEEKNNTFKYFFEGDFLDKNLNNIKNKNKSDFLIINEDSYNYINDLYTVLKNTEKFNGKDFKREMKYNIRKYYHKEDFNFDIEIQSMCLKFIKQNKANNFESNINLDESQNIQKLYLPFTYLLFFYLLDFDTFKIFLSEILIYNEEKSEMKINEKEIKNVLIRYKKYIRFNLGPYFEKNKEINNLDKITYNCNERLFLKKYDWILHLDSDESEQINNNKNIIYKVELILPMIKFNLNTRKIKFRKYIHKNLIISLLKSGFEKWEEKILRELFLNKKFRYLMNTLMSKNQIKNKALNEQKFFLDRIEYNHNIKSKYRYEFFITDVKKEHSRYFFISSFEILLFYGRTNDKFFFKKNINLKDSLNIHKYSKYWGYITTILKCLEIDKEKKKARTDFKILENSPTKLFKLNLEENKGGYKDKIDDKNNEEKLKNFHNQGYILCKKENLLIDIYLINFLLVELCISRLNIERINYKINKELLNIILEKPNSLNNLNIYLNKYSDKILYNKSILTLNLEEFKPGTHNKNLNKNFQERLTTTISVGLLNKSNTFKAYSIDSFNTTNRKNNSIKRGVSGSVLFDSIRKSNTKVGTIQKIEGKRSDYKAKRISQWKKIFQYNAQKNENRQQPILNLNLNINEKKERNISFIDINNNNTKEEGEIKSNKEFIEDNMANKSSRKLKKMPSRIMNKYIKKDDFENLNIE